MILLKNSIEGQIFDNVEDLLWHQIIYQTYCLIEYQLYDRIYDQIVDRVWERIWNYSVKTGFEN